jgi:hypothetical protein
LIKPGNVCTKVWLVKRDKSHLPGPTEELGTRPVDCACQFLLSGEIDGFDGFQVSDFSSIPMVMGMPLIDINAG